MKRRVRSSESMAPPKVSALAASVSIYLLLAPFDYFQVISGISLAKVAVVLPLTAAILSARRMRLQLNGLTLALYLYLLVMLVSLFASGGTGSAMTALVPMLLNVALVFVMSCFVFSDREIKLMVIALLVGAWVIVGAMVLTGAAGALSQSSRLVASIGGYSPDPNVLCGWLILPAAFYVSKVFQERRIRWIWCALASPAAALFAGSRGGLFGILAAIIVSVAYGMYTQSSSRRLILPVLCLFPFLYYVFDWLLGSLPLSVAARFAYDGILLGGRTSRLSIWIELLGAYSKAPWIHQLFGYGPLGSVANNTYRAIAHNTLLENLIDFGLAGLVSYLLILWNVFRRAWRVGYAPYVASLLGMMVLMSTLSGLTAKSLFSIFLLVAISRGRGSGGESASSASSAG